MALEQNGAPREGEPGCWYSRLVFQRGLAAVYLVAFLVAVNQFVPLLGDHGLLPVSRFVAAVPVLQSPSLFYLAPHDAAFQASAWLGVVLSVVALSGVAESSAAWTAALWGSLWLLYLSFVNVGQVFYAFGWETLLLETGFYMIVAGSRSTRPSVVLTWIWRWTLFRVMFGAGLIKLRGDPCWRNLTCLDYYFETQPMPNPLSWYFHWLPPTVHHAGVVVNHLVEVAAPFLYFAPQPVASLAGLATIAFQFVLIVSGNLSWLNWLTIVLAVTTLDDRWFVWLRRWVTAPAQLAEPAQARRGVVWALALLVGVLSVGPVLNLLSPGQLMNASFNPVHLVNTYGAFGSITRTRTEIVIEGTSDALPGPGTVWREYAFKAKPGDVSKHPPQIAPYHLRLGWLMWFAAMSDPSDQPWFRTLLVHLLEGDRATIGLLAGNPFPDRPPRSVRAVLYSYRFTTPAEHRATGDWWKRERVGLYFAPATLSYLSNDSTREARESRIR